MKDKLVVVISIALIDIGNSFIQAHAGSVIEQMDTLLTLKDMVEKNKKLYQPDLTANLEKSILSKLNK